MEMGNSILAAIIRITAVSNIGLVIFQPVGNGTFIFFHLSGNQSHISTVVHIMMPIILQSQLLVCRQYGDTSGNLQPIRR